MLVKKQWSRSSGLPPGYNEQTQRKIPVDRSEAWEERLVVLKKGRVEIYDDWVRVASRVEGDAVLTTRCQLRLRAFRSASVLSESRSSSTSSTCKRRRRYRSVRHELPSGPRLGAGG